MTGHYVIPTDKLDEFVRSLLFAGATPMRDTMPELPEPIRDALREMAIVPPEECRNGGSAKHITFEADMPIDMINLHDGSVWDAVDPIEGASS